MLFLLGGSNRGFLRQTNLLTAHSLGSLVCSLQRGILLLCESDLIFPLLRNWGEDLGAPRRLLTLPHHDPMHIHHDRVVLKTLGTRGHRHAFLPVVLECQGVPAECDLLFMHPFFSLPVIHHPFKPSFLRRFLIEFNLLVH